MDCLTLVTNKLQYTACNKEPWIYNNTKQLTVAIPDKYVYWNLKFHFTEAMLHKIFSLQVKILYCATISQATLWRPEEPTVVSADNCGWPRVLWTLGLHLAVGQEVRVTPEYATLPVLLSLWLLFQRRKETIYVVIYWCIMCIFVGHCWKPVF